LEPEKQEEPLDALPVLAWWVRGALVGVVLGLVTVFSIALWLHPYEPVRVEYVATLAAAPDAPFPGNLPWPGLAISMAPESPYEFDRHAPADTRTPRKMETHRQLGLPPCSFKTATGGMPCPSCGMTTSFALLVRGDVYNSLRANCAGTLLATLCLLAIPWCVASVWLGRPVFMVSLESTLIKLLLAFVAVMLVRWIIVLVWIYASRPG
jgi:hypothetical protein